MKIANPIYDVVFKFLMEDNKIAKLIIGKIIGKNIIELTPKPQENTISVKDSLTVYRLDYSAVIEDDNGEKKVIIIEIQKAKLSTDIMRFRNYLGKEYSSKQNYTKDNEVNIAIPIINIYILGHKLEHTTAPILKVSRNYIDVVENKKIKEKEYFIESLTHDSFVIQIPFLTQKRRNELETLLSVFDQNNRTEDFHILNIKGDDFPKELQEIIRRLKRAKESEEVQDVMDIEDEVLEGLQEDYRKLQKLNEEIEILSKEKDEISKEKDEIEKKSYHDKIEMIKILSLSNVSIEIISKTVDFSVEKIEEILNNI